MTVHHISENFIIITFMEKESIPGLTIEFMRENGVQTKCTVKAHLLGQMAENMLVNT